MAEAEFDPTAFDTISWNTPEERLERGTVVWSFSCSKCHGDAGLGDGELARVEGLTMPMITDADWGLYGLQYRDIDAVAQHIEDVLRAEP